MLTPAHSPTSTPRISAQAWQQFSQALCKSKNVQQTAVQSEGVLDNIVDLVNRIEATLSEQDSSYIEHILQEILLFALVDDRGDLSYGDGDGNQYAVKKENGRVSLTKQMCSATESTLSNGLPFCPHEETLLYQFEARELRHGLHSGSLLFSLLNNNQKVLRQLANQIINNDHQLFSPTLGRVDI